MELDVNEYFDFVLGAQQQAAFKSLIEFVDDENTDVFVLRGYAGTGKTTLMSGLVKYLGRKELPFTLLASTGRAAKILSDKVGMPVSTIHSCIYKFDRLNQDLSQIAKQQSQMAVDDKGQISLLFNMIPIIHEGKQIYVVDEASMVSDQLGQAKNSFAHFGSGNLLFDLFEYDRNGKFIFIGDPCQLPPVNQEDSPALDFHHLDKSYRKSTRFYELTEVVRQSATNGITKASFKVRALLKEAHRSKWAYFPIRDHENIYLLSSHAELIATYLKRIRQYGVEYATLICQTNRHCSAVNQIVRASLHGNQRQLCKGDLLMVTQNNYLCPLVNGDLVTVEGIGGKEYRCGLSFLQVEVKEIGSGKVFRLPMVEDLLYGISTNLNGFQHKKMMIDFYERMQKVDVRQNTKEFNERMLVDPYLNALKAVFGYALTCHKSQGGEWDEVFMYMDNKIQGMPRQAAYQWFYTGMTRAKERLFGVSDWQII